MSVKIPLKGWVTIIAWWLSAGALLIGFGLVVLGSMLGLVLVLGGFTGTISFYMLAIVQDIELAKKAKVVENQG